MMMRSSLLVLLFSGVASAAVSDAGLPEGPCGEEQTCLPEGAACLGLEDSCCGEFACVGYNFFKSCQEIPECFPEWYSCEVGGLPCCKGLVRGEETVDLVCAETHSGMLECQEEEITTRNAELPPRPTPAPTPVNHETVRDPNNPVVTYKTGCLWGDPHVDTLDGLAYDCMGNGEFVVLKSEITQRQVQGRFIQLENRRMTATSGIVIQDEGDVPKLQFTMPMTNEGGSHRLLRDECSIQFFVNDVQMDLRHFVHPDVKVVLGGDGKTIWVRYMASEFRAKIEMGYWNGCHLTHCYWVPDNDKVIGLLGDMDGNPNNDWMDREGNEVAFDPSKVRWNFFGPEGGYNYCTDHWCLREPEKSLFVYNEVGYMFGNFQRCDLPADQWVTDDLIDGATEEIMDACGGNLACVADAVTGDLESALASMETRKAVLAETCNNAGGECEAASCCGNLVCFDDGEGKKCVPEIPDDYCMPSFGFCKFYPCCEGATCQVNEMGKERCHSDATCMVENRRCADDNDCCDDLHCIGEVYEKVCKPVTTLSNGAKCLPETTACYDEKPCCQGSVCLVDTDGMKRCMPDVCGGPESSCQNGCCDGLECHNYRGRDLCLIPDACHPFLAECTPDIDGVPCCKDNHECVLLTSGPNTGKHVCKAPSIPAPE